MTAPTPGTVLLHPAPEPGTGGRQHGPRDPDACRLIAIATAHPGEWSWRRLTGLALEVPSQWSDVSGWRPQPLAEVAEVLNA